LYGIYFAFHFWAYMKKTCKSIGSSSNLNAEFSIQSMERPGY
jgi:hypothetical protein